ncbi:MAG: aspartate kinase, partial [Bacteroidota bacterium]|nr:aspartate kinase [Bacteroidota bacterium]
MKVLKFGGTSVGSVENMRAVMQLITDGNQKLVVLSAMSGTTNSLVEIANYLQKKNKDSARQLISQLEQKYQKVVNDLYTTAVKKEMGKSIVSGIFQTIKSFTSGDFNEDGENAIVAQGELLSTALFTELMLENGYKTVNLPALDFMKIDSDKAADLNFIRENIAKIIAQSEDTDYYITQGFICRNAEGNIDN